MKKGSENNRLLEEEIEKRKKAEQELQTRLRRDNALFWNSPVGLFQVDISGNCVYVNDAACKICGFSPEKLYRLGWVQALHPEDREKVLSYWSSCVETKKPFEMEYRFQLADKSVSWVIGKCSPYLDQYGEIWYAGTLVDITQFKQVEQELLKSEEKFKSYIERSPDGIFIIDDYGNYIDVNPAGCAMLGYTKEEMLKLNITDIGTPMAVNGFYKLKIKGEFQEEIDLIKKDGSTVTVELKAVALEEKRYIGFVRDLTAKKKMEEHFIKVDKLDSLGLLAGGIAHDFNNYLTIISGNVALANMKLNDTNKQNTTQIKNLLSEAEKGSLQAKGLTQQLLTFARGGIPVLKTMFVENLLQDSVSFAFRGSNCSFSCEISENLWAVKIDPGQISQALNNLLINARQAMPTGGILKLFAENIEKEKESPLFLKSGKYVKIIIKDNGIGIKQEHLQRIFDPYFSTKQEGSGLGLATTYSIIKKHNGHIDVQSELGIGTTFMIYLPAITNQVIQLDIKHEIGKSSGRILVMDDDKSVRDVVKKILTHFGYEVTTAREGKEAIKLHKEALNSRPFDVVIMDLTVPGGMGGKEAISKLLKLDKNAKVIVSSGYSNDPVMANFKDYGFCGVVLKPFDTQELKEVLWEVTRGGASTQDGMPVLPS